ncbi:hypothetical protein SS17_7048 (plasmid) [Escherichia coli O157:H7 str. SS17]|nr:hypothetical protein SS17_7048 [Escherichia coli O157:H7 str. SS17]EIN33766.1 hypothetical protein ECFRIK1990_5901 [Escherichia coli FRIK1990]EIP56042.1 hypothetical protein ECEC4436_5710 [Escherichia coli EC4436]EKH09020.1 hypothetical protein ECFDA506_5615 [Escherichia coli FDA506]EKI02000.1 hypothetical protein ECMA6_5710 [Escherichia coli MA6]EKK91569.1 hypothetical protein EC100821_5079 [Escherichia coli 10.0821]
MRRSRAGRCTARASIASYGRNATPLKRSESRSEQFLMLPCGFGLPGLK